MSKSQSLEEYAEEIRADLKVPRQSELFAHAVEAGYLAARADGEVDADERTVLVKAVGMLSQGAVIEWEIEGLLDECEARATKDGADERASQIGQALKELGQAEAGLLVAAFVARATNGVAKSEADVLKSIGKAAGLTADKVKGVVKRATGLDA